MYGQRHTIRVDPFLSRDGEVTGSHSFALSYLGDFVAELVHERLLARRLRRPLPRRPGVLGLNLKL